MVHPQAVSDRLLVRLPVPRDERTQKKTAAEIKRLESSLAKLGKKRDRFVAQGKVQHSFCRPLKQHLLTLGVRARFVQSDKYLAKTPEAIQIRDKSALAETVAAMKSATDTITHLRSLQGTA